MCFPVLINNTADCSTDVNRFHLVRYSQPKLFIGQHDLRVLIAFLMRSSAHHGGARVVAFQHICLLLIPFYTAARPSSLGPAHAQYEEEGKVSDDALCVSVISSSYFNSSCSTLCLGMFAS